MPARGLGFVDLAGNSGAALLCIFVALIREISHLSSFLLAHAGTDCMVIDPSMT